MPKFSGNLAVVMGINRYGNGISLLKTPVNDVREIARILEQDHHYQVIQLLDQQATLDALQQLLHEELPKHIQPDSRLLFYFAGHGIALNGDDGPEGYLIPQDAKLGDVKTYLPMLELQAALSNLPCRHFLGILDCCFAGAFRWSSTRKLELVEQGIVHKERFDRFITDPAWQVITSAAYDQTALDSLTLGTERGQIGDHSPFAAALIEALSAGGKADTYPPADSQRNQPAGDGVTTATDLYVYLRDRIEPVTDGIQHRQTPGIWLLKKHDKGEYIFLTPGHVLNLLPAPPLDESKNPYRGLQSFEAEQSDLFFGRQALTQELGNFVNKHPLSVVLGASGSGKSSLVKAGLIPSLKQDAKTGQFPYEILAPMRPGESPFKALSSVLAQKNVPGFLLLEAGSVSEANMLTQYMVAWSQQHPGVKLLLAIDQFEELITLCHDEQKRAQFLHGLEQAVTAYPEQLRLVLTLRSDFEPQFQNGALKEQWRAARFVVPPMTRSELREAIEEPASKRVMYFQSDDSKNPLVDQLIDEVAEMPGALPLLSFALSELYLMYLHRQKSAQDQGDSIDRAMTEADYRELGGVARSLTQRADQEYDKLVAPDPEYAKTIQNIMLRMVTVGGELARRRVPMSEFEYPPAQNDRVKEVIQRFSAARLLVEGQDSDGKPYVEPAHDALVRGWQKLLAWKQEREESLILQRRLTPAAEEWKDVAAKKQPEGVLTKAEPVIDWFDRRFYAAESLLNKASVQVGKWKQSQQQKRLRETPAQFLWTTNPYLDVLNQQLQSANSWFNQVESDFVQKSVLQRRKNTSWRWRIAIGVILGLSGLTIAALIGQRNAQIGQTTAFRASSEANFRGNEQLNALVDSLRASKGIKQILFAQNDLSNQVEQTLRSMVYGAKESNRSEAPPGDVFSLFMFFTGDRQLRAITNNNGAVRLWDIYGNQLAELQGQEELFPGGVSVSSDGNRIATATKDGTVRLWDLQGSKLGEFAAHKCQINESWQRCIDRISFSPDGSKIAIARASGDGQNQSIRIWHLADNTFEEIPIGTPGSLAGIGFNPNNELLVAINSGNCLRVAKGLGGQLQDLACGNIVGSLMEARFSPDGKRAMIFYGEESENAVLWNFLEGSEPQSINNQDRISRGGSFSLDGQQLAATGVDGTVNLLLGDAGWTTFKLPQGRVRRSTFSPDGKQLVTLGDDNTIRLWDLEQQPLSKSTLLQPGIESISFSPDGQTLVTIDSAGTIRLLDRQGNQIDEFTELPKITSVSFSPNGQTLATTGEDGKVRLLNLQGKLLKEFSAHRGNVTSAVWSQDGEKIATIGDGGDNDPDTSQSVGNLLVRLWDTQGNSVGKYEGSWNRPFESVGFQADGQPIMVAQGQEISETGNIYLSDALGRLTNIIPGRQAGDVFNLVKLSSDGSFLLTASPTPSTIRFWNLSGEKIIEFPGTAKNLSLSPDNSVLAVTGEDGSTELWQLGNFDELFSKGCDRVRDYLKHNPNVRESDRRICD